LRVVLANIEAAVRVAGGSLSHAVRLSVYLRDLDELNPPSLLDTRPSPQDVATPTRRDPICLASLRSVFARRLLPRRAAVSAGSAT